MFDILFGWRRASKCKKLIMQVQSRLKQLKSKRHSIVRQLREDVARLIKIGYEDIAFNRADHLFRDENTVAVYELLDNFCEFIVIHLSYIRKNKDCPNDINEAVSSLIFASARCGDLPELRAIRKLFGERYGQRFEMTALELLPGNLVNPQVKERLSLVSVPDEVKQILVDEIARDYCLRPEILMLEYTAKLQRKVKEHSGLNVLDTRVQTNVSRIDESQVEGSNSNDIEGKAIFIDAVSTSINLAKTSESHRNCNIISTSSFSSIAQQSSPDKFEGVDLGTKESKMACRAYVAAPKFEEEQKIKSSSSESFPQFPEEMIAYLDDIAEFQSSTTKEGSSQDQRIFKFKSSLQRKNQNVDDSCDARQVEQCGDGNKKSSPSSSRKMVDATRIRSRRRSLSRENLSVKDIDSLIYYHTPCNPTHKHRPHLQHSKYHEKNLVEKFEEKSQKLFQASHCFNHEAADCCLNHPCYFCASNGREDHEVSPQKQNQRITTIHGLDQRHICRNFQHCCHSMIGDSDAEMELYTFPMPRRRGNFNFGTITHDPFTKLDCCSNKQSKIRKGNIGEFDSAAGHIASTDSCLKTASPSRRKGSKPPYLRAMTMPQTRTKDSRTGNVLLSTSFPIKSPNHVHPMLPDYDDIAAKFMALKKQHLQNRQH